MRTYLDAALLMILTVACDAGAQSWRLYRVNTDGSGLYVIAKFGPNTSGVNKLAFSPDGVYLLISLAQEGHDRILLAKLGGSSLQELKSETSTDSSEAFFTSDGKDIVFWSSDFNGHEGFYTMAADGTAKKILFPVGQSEYASEIKTAQFNAKLTKRTFTRFVDTTPPLMTIGGISIPNLAALKGHHEIIISDADGSGEKILDLRNDAEASRADPSFQSIK